MRKVVYASILPLLVLSGLVFAGREVKTENPKLKTTARLSAAEREAGLKKWEASPDGVSFKKWEASAAGKKVHADAAKIKEELNAFTTMEAVVTSLFLPPGSRLGFGVMARINGVDYIVKFEPEKAQLEQLRSLKVNDKLLIKSHHVSSAPKYAYPIVTGEYVERDGKVIFKRVPRKDGC